MIKPNDTIYVVIERKDKYSHNVEIDKYKCRSITMTEKDTYYKWSYGNGYEGEATKERVFGKLIDAKEYAVNLVLKWKDEQLELISDMRFTNE